MPRRAVPTQSDSVMLAGSEASWADLQEAEQPRSKKAKPRETAYLPLDEKLRWGEMGIESYERWWGALPSCQLGTQGGELRKRTECVCVSLFVKRSLNCWPGCAAATVGWWTMPVRVFLQLFYSTPTHSAVLLWLCHNAIKPEFKTLWIFMRWYCV